MAVRLLASKGQTNAEGGNPISVLLITDALYIPDLRTPPDISPTEHLIPT
jgi:hypothetical protein